MKIPDEIKKGLECLDKMQFFMGQRAGRELWMEKPKGVQDSDLERYNRDVDTVRALIRQLQEDLQLEKKRTDALAMELAVLKNAKKQLEDHLREATKKVEQLEAERDAAVDGLKKAANEKGECFECKWYNGKNCTHQDYKTICCSHDDKWEWRGVQKEE